MNFLIYLIGYLLVVAGVGYAMHAAGIGSQWIIAMALAFGGLGLVYALSRSKRDEATTGTTHQTTTVHHDGP